MYPTESSGLWSLGVIRVASASLTSFGAAPSLIGISFAFLINTLCAFCFSTLEQQNLNTERRCRLASWLHQLSLLCWVAATSTELSSYLDYYDDLNHHSYLHLVPIDVFPRVMPLVVLFVISALFALGLESSTFLHKLSSILLWSTFTLFAISCVTLFTINFGEFTLDHEVFAKSALAAAVWSSFIVETVDCSVSKQINSSAISSILYSATVIILSSLDASRNGDIGSQSSLLEPLGAEYPWYRLVMVPTISCGLGMALYQQYIPALLSVAQKTPISCISKANRITGTKLLAITLVGVYCSILIYLYSPGQLVLTGSAASLSSKAIHALHVLSSKYSPSTSKSSRKSRRNKKKKGEYEAVSADDVELVGDGLSSDSGHSTDTDIDEIVHEYKVNAQIINGQELRKPSKKSSIVVLITLIVAIVLASLLSLAISQRRYAIIPWAVAGMLMMYVTMYFQPKRVDPKTNFDSLVWFLCIVSTTLLFGMIFSAVWIPLLLWLTLGMILTVHDDLSSSVLTFGAKRTVERLHRLTLQQLPAPRIEIKLHAIQLRNKPV